MPSSEATLTTARAARYAAQLVRHASAMAGERGHRIRVHGGNPLASDVRLHVTRASDHAVLTFDPWGSCTVLAEGERLALRIDAADEDRLQHIQEIITRDVERFAAREHLSLTWERADPASASAPPRKAHRVRGRVLLTGGGIAAVAAVLMLHAVLGGAVIAGGWWGWTAGGLALTALVLAVAHATVPMAALRLRRRFSRDRDLL